MKLNCSICGEVIDTDTMKAMVKVIGWVEMKASGPGGTIKEPSEPLGWAHKVCIDTTPGLDQSLF